MKSPLRSPEFVGLKVKDGICDRFRLKTGARPSVDTRESDMRIQLFMTDRMATIYLDTSGEALFKRGYRQDAGEAPLRETSRLASWRSRVGGRGWFFMILCVVRARS